MRRLKLPKVAVRMPQPATGGTLPRVRPTDPGGVKRLTKSIETKHAKGNGYYA